VDGNGFLEPAEAEALIKDLLKFIAKQQHLVRKYTQSMFDDDEESMLHSSIISLLVLLVVPYYCIIVISIIIFVIIISAVVFFSYILLLLLHCAVWRVSLYVMKVQFVINFVFFHTFYVRLYQTHAQLLVTHTHTRNHHNISQ